MGASEERDRLDISTIIRNVHQSISVSAKRLRRLFAIRHKSQSDHSKPNPDRPREPVTFTTDPPLMTVNTAERPIVSPILPLQPVERIRRGDFELRLRATIFETELTLSTSSPEPAWISTFGGDHSLFPGWRKLMPYPLTPQGRFVADTKKTVEDLLQNVEFGANVQVLGSGGGFTSRALPGFLRTLLTSYQWLGMWRSSENRSIHISETWFKSEQNQPLTSEQVDKLQEVENELISLDKYKGGHSEYLTVITHSDAFTGAVALFKASFRGDSLITRLDLATYIRDVPREICRILRDDVKPNRYDSAAEAKS
jgi:hypothetical protein